MTHTPEPWFAEHGTPSGRRLVADLVEGRASLTHYRIVHEGQEEGGGEADALLIAQAPAMARLLRGLVELAKRRGSLHEYAAAVADVERVLAAVEGTA
jgi:hypothetical protein